MTGAIVTLWALVALSPWWVRRAELQRRSTRVPEPLPRDGRHRRHLVRARRRRFARQRSTGSPHVDLGVTLELLAAAVRAGASLPRALHTVGAAVGGEDGAALERVAGGLVIGASWAGAWRCAPARLAPVARALAPTWEHGAGPVEALRVAAAVLRAERQAAAATAAARLGVRLVLPLGLCYLPAFVLIGLVPLLASLGRGVLA